MLWILLFACFLAPEATPHGTLTFPIEVGHPVTIEWAAPAADQSLWVDVATSNGRTLSGDVVVSANGTEIERGTLGLGHSLVSPHNVMVHNWVSTPDSAHGQMFLADLDDVSPGTPMRAVFDLRPGGRTTVTQLVLQVREERHPLFTAMTELLYGKR
jgi:hypothetical protein